MTMTMMLLLPLRRARAIAMASGGGPRRGHTYHLNRYHRQSDEEIMATFRKLDKNQDGVLSRDELAAAGTELQVKGKGRPTKSQQEAASSEHHHLLSPTWPLPWPLTTCIVSLVSP
jgi:hypothetical protein